MKRIVLFALSALPLAGIMAAASANDGVLLDFESAGTADQSCEFVLGEGAALDAAQAYEGRQSLRITGVDKPAQVAARIKNVKLKAGKVYAVTYQFKGTAGFPYMGLYFNFSYKDGKGASAGTKAVLPMVWSKASPVWQGAWRQFRVPDNAESATMDVLVGKTPATESIWLDAFSVEEVPDPYAGIHISFEDWVTQPVKQLLLGPRAGAEVVKLYKDAHSPENCLVVEGQNEDSQYSVILEDVWVKPGIPYDFSFFYRTTPQFPTPNWARVVMWQYNAKDEFSMDGFSHSDFKPQPVSEWTEARFGFMPKADTCRVRLAFLLLNIPRGQKIYIDDISFKRADPKVVFDYAIDPDSNTLSGKISVPGGKPKDYTVLIREYDPEKDQRPVYSDEKGKFNTDFSVKVYGPTVKALNLKPGDEAFTIDLADFKDGHSYVISASATLEDGKTISRKDLVKNSVFYVFKTRPWENNQLGVLGPNDPPPRPWMPIQWNAKSKTCTVWNNVVGYGSGLLIEKMKPLIQPIALTLNGQPFSALFKFSEPEAIYRSPHKVTLRSHGKGDAFDVVIDLTVEFDGFAKYSVTLKPKTAATVEQMALALTLPKQLLANVDTGPNNKISLRDKTSWGTKEFTPGVWVGDDEAGLVWCADRILPSTRYQATEWVRLDNSQPQAAMTIHLVNQPVELKDQPLTVEFALLPTPTRPPDREFRDMRFRASVDPVMSMLYDYPNRFRWFGFPVASSAELMDRNLATGAGMDRGTDQLPGPTAGYGPSEQPGLRPKILLFYMDAAYAMETVPEVTYFRKKWLLPEYSYPGDVPGSDIWSGPLTAVDLSVKGWADLLCARLDAFLKRFAFDGVYLDVSDPQCKLRDGAYTCPMFEARDLHKRIGVIVQRRRPSTGRIWFHSSTGRDMPFVSFSDWILTGEHFQQKLARYSYYMEFLTLDQFRCEAALGFGPGIIFWPQYVQPGKDKDKRLACHVVGLGMLHGMDVGSAFMNRSVNQDTRDRKRTFGSLVEATFYPYWKENPYLKTDKPEVVFSFYERKGELFIILFNNSAKQQTAELTFLEPYVKVRPKTWKTTIYDPVENRDEPAVVTDDRLRFTLEPYLSKLVICKR